MLILDTVGYHINHALSEGWRRYATRFAPFFLTAYPSDLNLMWSPHSSDRAAENWWLPVAQERAG